MKKALTLLCVALCVTSLFANVVTGTCGDNLQWAYDTDTHALTITGWGDMFWSGERPWAQVASEITSVSLPDGLTSIGDDAFEDCSSLTSITIPNSVTSIGSSAFNACSSLTSVTIGNSVTSIGFYAFHSCSSLTSIIIPNSVTSIGGYAFRYCSSLTFVTLGNGLTSIVYCAFQDCSSLTSITIPNSVTSIEHGAFSGCNFTSVTIPNSVTSIEYDAFRDCSQVTMLGTTPPSISASTFSDNVTVFVPCSAMDAYLAAPVWQFLDLYGLSHHVNLTATEGGSAKITATDCESNSVTIEANPTDCNRFKQWSDGNTDNPRTLTLTRDIALTAEFEAPKYYTVNISGGYLSGSYEYEIEGCSTSWTEFYDPSSLQLTMREGTSISVRENSNCGLFLGWSDGVTERERTIVITSDTTIYSIIEAPKYYTVNISGSYLSGSYEYEIEGCSTSWTEFYDQSSLQLTMREGTSISVRENSNCGLFLGWSDGVTERERTVVITSDTIISSLFETLQYYTVNIGGDNLCGSYEVVGGMFCNTDWTEFYNKSSLQLTMREGTSITFSDAYVGECGNWTGWSDGVTERARTIVITSDTTIYSIIEYPKIYTVNISGDRICGYYSGYCGGSHWEEYYGTSSVQLFVNEGASITVREEGSCGTWLGWSDGVTEKERTIFINSDTTISSHFDVETYSVSITAGEGGYLENGNIELEVNECNRDWIYTCAYAYDGYYFVGWSDGNTDQCINIYPYEDINLVAQFAPKQQVTVLLGVDNASKGMGVVTGGGIYYSGDYVTISATPNSGYHFVEWSDGIGDATRELYLQSDTTLFATFAPGEYGGKCGDNLYWTYSDNTITITGSGDMKLYGYSAWRHEQYQDWYTSVSAVQFPEGITSIDHYAFSEMSLTNVVVPASVTYFGENAFAYNDNLTRFEYQGTEAECEINSWGGGMLSGSFNLVYFKGQKDMLDHVGQYDHLDTVIVTSGKGVDCLYGVSYIDNAKANDCELGYGYIDGVKMVKTLILPEGLQEIGDFALMNARYLSYITIPAGVTRIGESAFEDCRLLDSITFAGKALREIDDWAFYNCHSLKNITIPEGVTEIGDAAFYGCTYLTEITLPSSVQEIADNGFALCAKLQKMHVKAATPPTIQAKTFFEVNRQIPVYVPNGSVDAYKDDPYWQEFDILPESSDLEEIVNNNQTKTLKFLYDGQLIILRDNKTYNVIGAQIQ